MSTRQLTFLKLYIFLLTYNVLVDIDMICKLIYFADASIIQLLFDLYGKRITKLFEGLLVHRIPQDNLRILVLMCDFIEIDGMPEVSGISHICTTHSAIHNNETIQHLHNIISAYDNQYPITSYMRYILMQCVIILKFIIIWYLMGIPQERDTSGPSSYSG